MQADFHMHLGFSKDGAGLAAQAGECGLHIVSMTMRPGEYAPLLRLCEKVPQAHIAAGLHPYLIADGTARSGEVDELCSVAAQTRFIGEVGLDFSRGREASRKSQLDVFEKVMGACAKSGGKIISIHAVSASGDALDVLERTSTNESCACIMHWFSGTSEELARAVRMGLYFSAGERMLATRRGREYIRQIPANRLLIETDMPSEGSDTGFRELKGSLDAAAKAIARIKGATALESISQTAARLLCAREARL